MFGKSRREVSTDALVRAAGRARPCAVESLEIRTLLSGPPSHDPAGDLWDGSLPGSAVQIASLIAGALRFEGAFVMNTVAHRIENVGAFRVGMRATGTEPFRPLLTVNGSLTYDTTKVFSITNADVDALIAGAPPAHLFTGAFTIAFADAWTRSLTETNPLAGLSLGPATLSLTSMAFANPFGGTTADSRVQLRGGLNLPAAVGGGVAVAQEASYAWAAPEGIGFTGAPVPGGAGATVAYPTITLRAAANVWVDFAPSGATGAGELRVSGNYTLPDFSGATVTLTRPGSADAVYITSSGQPGSGSLGMNAPMRANDLDITWDGSWRLDNVKFEVLSATTIVTTNAYLYMGGNTPNSVTAKVIANKRVEIEFTYQNGPDLSVHGAGIDLTQPGGFFFTSDKTPTANGRADNWDPEIRLYGNMQMQPNADGTGAGQLVFAIPAAAPLKANFDGASMPAITQAGPQVGVQLLGIRAATLTNTKIELKLDDDYFQLDTTAKYAEFNDQVIEFRGEDDFGFDVFIKVRDFFDVSVDGFLELEAPIVITDDWRFDDFFFWVQPNALGSQNGFKGTALLETPLRQGPDAYQTTFLITLAAFDFTVDPNSTPGPAFLAAGMPVTLLSMTFTPDRMSPPNQFANWDPQLALVGTMPIPIEWGGFVLPFGGPQAPILVNENGIDVSAGWSMPAGQTFKIINVVNVTTVAGLRMFADLVNDTAKLDGTFTLPSLGGAVLDSRAVNGHSFDLKFDDNALTTDFAANAATGQNTEAPIWTDFKLGNINVGVTKQYGQPGVMGGTASLLTNLNPIPLTLTFVNGVLQATNGALNAAASSFTFIGTLLKPLDFTFIPDRDVNNGPVWDPLFTFGGGLTLPNGFGDGTFVVPLLNLPERVLLTVDGLDLSATIKFPLETFDFTMFGQRMRFVAKDLSLSVLKPPGQQFSLKAQGIVEVRQTGFTKDNLSFNADLSGPTNYFQIFWDRSIAMVGKLKATEVPIFSKKFALIKELLIGFDTVNHVYSADAKVNFFEKKNFDIVMGVEFLNGSVNRITAGVDGLKKPVYKGIYFDGFTGTVRNFAPGATGRVEIGGSLHFWAGVAIPSDLQFSIDLPEFFGGRVKIDGKLIDLVIQGYASFDGVKGSAVLKYIANLGLGTANFDMNWAASPGYIKYTGTTVWLNGFFTDTGTMYVDFDGNFSGRRSVTLAVPNGIHEFFSGRLTRFAVRQIEGTVLARAEGGVKFTNDSNYGNDVIFGYGRIAGQVLGLKVFLDGTISPIFSLAGIPSVRVPGEFMVAPGTSEATFFAAWENDASTPPFELIDPDGNVVTSYEYVTDLEGPQNFGVRVANPAAGAWRLRVTDDTGLGLVEYEAYAPTAAPTIAITSPTADVLSPGVVNIGYEAYDADSDADISFYYTDTFGQFVGIPIGSAVEQDGAGSFAWDTTGLPGGDYTIYAQIDDGNNEMQGAFAVGRVTVVDPDAPPQVTGAQVLWLGGTKASLSWDAAPGAEYYIVSATAQAAGASFDTYFNVYDATSLELTELSAGDVYRFSVRAAAANPVEGAQSRLGVQSVPVTGVVGYTPGAPGAGEWDVFADPASVYSAVFAIPSGGSAELFLAPAGATLDGSGNFSWSVPGGQDGWSDVVIKVTGSDGSLSMVRYLLLSDADRTIDLGGQTWDDADNDGDRALAENGLSGVTVNLVDAETGAILLTLTSDDDDRNNDTTIDAYTEQGLYRFAGLTPGRYIVRVDPGSGVVTSPLGGQYDRTLAKGLEDDDLDFGVYFPPGGVGSGGGAIGGSVGSLGDLAVLAGVPEGAPMLLFTGSSDEHAVAREPWRAAIGSPTRASVGRNVVAAGERLSAGLRPETAAASPVDESAPWWLG